MINIDLRDKCESREMKPSVSILGKYSHTLVRCYRNTSYIQFLITSYLIEYRGPPSCYLSFPHFFLLRIELQLALFIFDFH